MIRILLRIWPAPRRTIRRLHNIWLIGQDRAHIRGAVLSLFSHQGLDRGGWALDRVGLSAQLLNREVDEAPAIIQMKEQIFNLEPYVNVFSDPDRGRRPVNSVMEE